MSRRTPSVRSEGIDSVGHSGWTDVRLETVAIDDVDRLIEKAGDVFLEVDILEHGDTRGRIDFDHDVDVAIRLMAVPRHRAKQGRMLPPPLTEGGFKASQGVKGFRAIHAASIAPRRSEREG